MRSLLLILLCVFSSCNYQNEPPYTAIVIINNDLKIIPDSVFSNKDLTSLCISCKGFTTYPPLSAPGEDGVSYVELPLNELPDKIGELTNLKTLKLNCTKVEELPKAITKLTKLDTLDLSLNKNLNVINELSKIKMLPGLKVLNIYHTKLDPSQIDYLKNQFNKKIKVIITKADYERSLAN